jgi:ammonium transporter, Amt family
MTGLCLGSVLWYFFGYSLTFGPSDWSNGFIGDFSNSVFAGVPITGCFRFAPTIPGTVFASFQMMFALMVPMIVTGAFAEKMKFEAFLLFTVLWPVFVYYPIASWVWNPSGFLGAAGAFDFAGGITIHTPAGVSSLVVALMMVKRRENFKLGHHNLPLTIVGGILVWAGWYSFNGASAFGANAIASQALLNTHVAACVAGMTWVVLLYVFDKDEVDGKRKWHLTEILSGALAGMSPFVANVPVFSFPLPCFFFLYCFSFSS